MPNSKPPDEPAARGAARPETARREAYRPEIQGLRAFAVLLVAAYHIWVGRVSGGVDVFLLLTGFFITGSLVRSVERHGRLQPVVFLTRLARRLMPTAGVVLLGILAMSWALLPSSRWFDIVEQTIASGLYFENWTLAAGAVDYLARDKPMSPLQHFWSLSIQGQFYPVWLALFAIALAAATLARMSLRRSVFALCAVVFAASLAYSVAATASNQSWAYFDTGARLWEFALGGMAALGMQSTRMQRLRLPVRLRIGLGWAGLAALVCCGALVDVSQLFPGWIALWPTGAALLVIAAGSTGSRWGADRLLTWRPLTALGDRSYALYLWHWPILVCYLFIAERTRASLLGGLAVLGLALALAFATKWLVEDRVSASSPAGTARRWSIAVAAMFLVPVLGAAGAAQAQLAERQAQTEAEIAAALEEGSGYHGAAVLTDAELAEDSSAEMPLLPPLETIDEDYPSYFKEGCDSQTERICVYGDPNGEHTIALVGASRVGHYFPAFEHAAVRNGWRILVFTMNSCQFSSGHLVDYKGDPYPECDEFNDWTLTQLKRERPDLAVTLADRATDEGERIYDGFVDRWRQLDRWGIDVLALRDLPRLDQFPSECLERNGKDACAFDADATQDGAETIGDLENVPDNVRFADLTAYVCPGRVCPAVIGDIVVYRDNAHLTATYAATLDPMVEATVEGTTGW